MEKTAVEWFFNELQRMQYFIGNDMLEAYKQAKQMEKEQIIDAFGVGCQVKSTRLIGYQGMAEQYYKESYKQD
jgi:hypothetical protein